ncbi:hypothetical protein Emag_001401 [Eimeria magna]
MAMKGWRPREGAWFSQLSKVKKLMDETAELTAVLETLEPTFETILLIWQHSRFYNKPSRLVVLVRQLCNAIITQVMRYVSGQDVFKLLQQDEPKEALDKLSFALEQIDFDPLSVDCKKTDSHFHAFRTGVKEIEQRLASVLAMSFEDCGTIAARVRLFDSFMPLLERPILREEAATQYTKLLLQFKEEVKEVHAIFLEGRKREDEDRPAFSNQPPVAKALNWAAGLLQRLREPLHRLEKLGQMIEEEPEELKDVCRQCESVAASIMQYQEGLRLHWSETEVEPSKAKLSAVLLIRHEGSLLKVNFHPDLTRLLREVKYMELQGLEVPAAAQAVHERAEIYRVQVSSLETICEQYNQVLTGLLPNQRPLLADRLGLIDSKLEPGLTTLSWDSDGVDDFISQASLAVSDAFTICDSITSNLQKSFGLLGSWTEKPLFERKPKPMSLEDADQLVRTSIANRLNLMGEDGKELHKILRDSSEALKATKGMAQWRAHANFVSAVVSEGFIAVAVASVGQLVKCLEATMGPRVEAQPLFEVKLELVDGNVDIVPAFRQERGSICSVLEGWVADFLKSASTTSRLDSGKGDYIAEVKDSYSFMDLEAFIAESPPEQLDVTGSEGEPLDVVLELIKIDLGRTIPQLSCFDEKITFFETLRSEIAELKTPVDIYWLRINAQPAKVQLSQLATSWASYYTNFLLNCCLNRADAITSFISRMDAFLSTKPPTENSEEPPDTDALYKFMTHIRDVKIASGPIKHLLGPIHEQVALLRKHGCFVEESRLQMLDAASSKWEEVIRKAFEAKEAILPMQNAEVNNIRNALETFNSEVAAFRETFLKEAPFDPNTDATDAYASIDSFYQKRLQMEQAARELNNLETLFDMAKSVHKELRDSKEDLKTLKASSGSLSCGLALLL